MWIFIPFKLWQYESMSSARLAVLACWRINKRFGWFIGECFVRASLFFHKTSRRFASLIFNGALQLIITTESSTHQKCSRNLAAEEPGGVSLWIFNDAGVPYCNILALEFFPKWGLTAKNVPWLQTGSGLKHHFLLAEDIFCYIWLKSLKRPPFLSFFFGRLFSF